MTVEKMRDESYACWNASQKEAPPWMLMADAWKIAAALRVVEAARAVDACLETYCFADPTHPDRIAFEKALDDLTAALAEWED